MYRLLATTSLTAIALLGAAPALAQVKIETARTTPVVTGTIDNGGPANVEITSAGSVTVTAGDAVTINSPNSVSNAGTIKATGVNDADGILVVAGGSGDITNSGTITLDEDYTPTDGDSDGDIDGGVAQGSNRFGIRTSDGLAHTGNITSSGTITVEGNNSGGIRMGGALNGSLSNTGTISVTGDNVVGIRTLAVSGDVKINGTVAAIGQNAMGVSIEGDVGGKLTVQGAIGATGYRYTTAPSDTTKLDADDLLQGGPAMRVTANVGGGLLLDAAPADKDTNDADEDDDGVDDASEGTAVVTSYGGSPALEIGAAQNITLGPVAGDAGSHGLVVKGSIGAAGVYANVDAVALSLGGKGGTVNLNGGLNNSGVINAAGLANATAVRAGSGTRMADLTNSGTIMATGGKEAAHLARAISIEAGASVPKLVNSGTIRAVTSGSGTATAVYDATGGLTLVENTGTVQAGGGAVGKSIAFDLRANTSGVTLRQLVVDATATAPSISGDVLFGSGNDLFEIADGATSGSVDFGAGTARMALSGDATHTGAVKLGAGADQLTLTGTSKLAGDVDFGGGADILTLAAGTSLTGKLSNAGALVATVSGTLDATNLGSLALGALDVTSTGTLGVTIDGTTRTATHYTVAGAASFAQGAKLLVHLNSITSAIGDYTVVSAGTLTGAPNLQIDGAELPFLFKSSLTTDQAAGTMRLTVGRKSASELQLNRSQASAYDAIFAVLDKDARITQTFLAIEDAAALGYRFSTFLPEHAGGSFESVTQASRAAARIAQDPMARSTKDGTLSVWIQQVAWGTSKNTGDTAAYDVGGWGVNGGGELLLGDFGRIGGSLGYYLGVNNNGDNDNSIETAHYEAAVHWRANFGGLGVFARASAGFVTFDGRRRFDVTGSDSFSRVADSQWDGQLYTASGGVSYEAKLGKRLRIRPAVTAEYFTLKEDSHAEKGGGDGFNLTVDERTSDELAVSGTLAVGYELLSLDPTRTWMRIEVEGGQRSVLGGSLGSTTARFAGGTPFTLSPEEREDGWIGRLRLFGGVEALSLGGEVGAEEQNGRVEVTGRIALQIGW